MSEVLDIATPRWSLPLIDPARYKGAYGGRGSGKSHFFAESAVEDMVLDADLDFVCIREIQKSLKFSAKRLIENKINRLGVSSMFEITNTEIRRVGGSGIMIFQGMQDHTADSIQSLEGFKRAWVEEAHRLSARSLKLLRPTIREEGSEIWFSWNPDQPEDAVDRFMRVDPHPDSVAVHVNYDRNPFLPSTLRKEMESDRKRMTPEDFAHVWEGAYNEKSESQVFAGHWRVDEFEPDPRKWDGPYQGLDFGFANDPTSAVRCWVRGGDLMVEYGEGKVGLELDHTSQYIKRRIPGFDDYETQADSARPESISYLRRHGLPKIGKVRKWNGSVEDGVEFMKSFDNIIIHPRCKPVIQEMRLYSYKTNKAGQVLPIIVDLNNHWIDAIRYALDPLIKVNRKRAGTW